MVCTGQGLAATNKRPCKKDFKGANVGHLTNWNHGIGTPIIDDGQKPRRSRSFWTPKKTVLLSPAVNGP
jgi:hypothetical protein